jgi:hypothetical protein
MLYVDSLERAGFSVELRSLFSDEYLRHLYERGRKSVMETVRGYVRRVRDLLAAKRFDVVWVEKELFPFLPGQMEKLLSATQTPYIVDYDDAIFHNYDLHESRWLRRMLGAKLTPLVSRAFGVTVGNRYLAEWAAKCGAKQVRLVPTVIETSRYPYPPSPREPGQELRIGWIGTPITTPYLWLVRDALKRASKSRPLRLVTVGAGPLIGYCRSGAANWLWGPSRTAHLVF